MYRFLCEHKIVFLWEKCPRIQLLGYYSCIFIFFNCKLFFGVVVSFYIYANSVRVIQILACFYLAICSDRCVVISYCSFILNLPNSEWFWTSFYVPINHLHILLGEMLAPVFCLFSIGLLDFYSWVLRVLQIHHLKIFSPSL